VVTGGGLFDHGDLRPDGTLDRDDLDDDPLEQFRRWLGEAESAGLSLAQAVALATADAEGRPSIRHVMLRGVYDGGFVFYTNLASRKARDLAENPHASLVALWREQSRQVSAMGRVEPASDRESDAYFADRPRDAQLGAWASVQSSVLADRAELERRFAEEDERFRGRDVPRPPFWRGFRLLPDVLEFWQGRAFRLHDRFAYTRDDARPSGWRLERLAP
jgi:pyridoxamine 5'-phosphate oxidase